MSLEPAHVSRLPAVFYSPRLAASSPNNNNNPCPRRPLTSARIHVSPSSRLTPPHRTQLTQSYDEPSPRDNTSAQLRQQSEVFRSRSDLDSSACSHVTLLLGAGHQESRAAPHDERRRRLRPRRGQGVVVQAEPMDLVLQAPRTMLLELRLCTRYKC